MSVTDVTREAVLSALAEHDDLGSKQFLDRYGFAPARVYELILDGRRYDSKAVIGVAHRYVSGSALRPQDFSGGEQTVVRHLRRLGFRVERRQDVNGVETGAPEGDLRGGLQRVLDLASAYSKDATPEMVDRDAAVRYCADAVRRSLVSIAAVLSLDDLDLRVDPGGRQSNYSPVPWIRMYSKPYSPTAMDGFYLVYLFAADGSRVYLSLNQGTSEFRSNAMRPINNRGTLISRAVEARAALTRLDETAAGKKGHTKISLAWETLTSVGPESKRRVRNYEDANILAVEYPAGRIPDDPQLLDDLADMMPLLAQLYGAAVTVDAADKAPHDDGDPAAEAARRTAARAQGRTLDIGARTAIELYAEDQAFAHWTDAGWAVNRVGQLKRGYDLECHHTDGRTLHVEVKGTQSRGEEVFLTRGEVHHCQRTDQCDAEHALYVLSEIRLDQGGATATCSGGVPTCVWPWTIEDNSLTPVQYAYQVPRT